MRLTAKMTGLNEALKTAQVVAAMGAMKAMKQAGNGLKEELRDQMRGAGFSDRLAKAWQSADYPIDQHPTLQPAALVFSKTPGIVDAYARGVTIVARAGRRLLAIPTEDTPRKGSGGRQQQNRAMSPKEVEARYGRRLRFVPAKSAQGSRMSGRAVAFLVMDDLVTRKESGKLRSASVREIAGTSRNKGRQVKWVIMFALVASVRIPKKLDLQGALNRAAATLPQLLSEEWGH